MHWLRLVKRNNGFTLVELLVVVVIISILAAVVVPHFGRQADKARAGRAIAELKCIKTIIDLYYLEKGSYPAADNTEAGDSIATVLQQDGMNWTGKPEGMSDPWQNGYRYAATADGYIVFSRGTMAEKGDEIVATHEQNPLTEQTVTETAGIDYDGVHYGSAVSSCND